VLSPDKDEAPDTVLRVIPISMKKGIGNDFEYEVHRLKTSDSNSDSQKEGLRLILKGGSYDGRDQKAVVEFICDKDRTGLEGEWDHEDEYVPERATLLGRRDAVLSTTDDEPDGPETGEERQLLNENAALIWNSYGPTTDDDSHTDVLRLTWHTKYACEKRQEGGSDAQPGHWGFFTWLVIL
jgi:hypothetical protein